MKFNKKAFTLVELLVVVLIIGILSAIALPQYQVGVEKARLSEALQNVSSLQKAIDIWLLENGYPEETIEFLGDNASNSGQLAIDLERAMNCSTWGGHNCISKNFRYYAQCTSTDCNIWIYRINNNDDSLYEVQWYRTPTQTWEIGDCEYELDASSSVDEKICKILQAQGN